MKAIQELTEAVIAEIASKRNERNGGNEVSIPNFRAGDVVSIDVRVVEGDKERLQKYEGIVISRKGSGVSATFTVRKISNGVGVERIFQLHSPIIQNINLVKKGNVRRAKLYYIRSLSTKAVRAKTT